MAIRMTPHLIDLTYDALLKSYWRKAKLRGFLKIWTEISTRLSQIDAESSKRDQLDNIFDHLASYDRGRAIIYEMALNLAKQISFPDLTGWENSKQQIEEATMAVQKLKEYLEKEQKNADDQKETEHALSKAREERINIQRSQIDKSKLKDRLDALAKEIGTQQGGYRFQDWFFDLLDYCEILNRRPYVSGGRQIDGSISLDGTTYLVELKFTATQACSTDIDSLKAKVDDKADNTMGLMVSISGYSSVAIQQASGRKTTIILFDYQHLYMFLTGAISFNDIILRVRRHASQTGDAYLRVDRF